MNPCKQHEKVDVDEHGTGFDCVYCKVAKLEADLHKYNTGQWSNPPADQYCPDCQCGRCIMREVSDE